jgi:hypothetical protein
MITPSQIQSHSQWRLHDSGDMPAYDAFSDRANAPNTVVRKDGRALTLSKTIKHTKNFFARIWHAVRNFFRGSALSSPVSPQVLQCRDMLKKAGLGANSERLLLSREMIDRFSQAYHHELSLRIGMDERDAHKEAREAAAGVVVNMLIDIEKMEGRFIPVEKIDFLMRELGQAKAATRPVNSDQSEPMIASNLKRTDTSQSSLSAWYSSDSIQFDPKNLPKLVLNT